MTERNTLKRRRTADAGTPLAFISATHAWISVFVILDSGRQSQALVKTAHGLIRAVHDDPPAHPQDKSPGTRGRRPDWERRGFTLEEVRSARLKRSGRREELVVPITVSSTRS